MVRFSTFFMATALGLSHPLAARFPFGRDFETDRMGLKRKRAEQYRNRALPRRNQYDWLSKQINALQPPGVRDVYPNTSQRRRSSFVARNLQAMCAVHRVLLNAGPDSDHAIVMMFKEITHNESGLGHRKS